MTQGDVRNLCPGAGSDGIGAGKRPVTTPAAAPGAKGLPQPKGRAESRQHCRHRRYLVGFGQLPEASLQVMEVLLPVQDKSGRQAGQGSAGKAPAARTARLRRGWGGTRAPSRHHRVQGLPLAEVPGSHPKARRSGQSLVMGLSSHRSRWFGGGTRGGAFIYFFIVIKNFGSWREAAARRTYCEA